MSEMAVNLHSAIYKGLLRHRRYSPRTNAFCYHVFMMYLDLDELDQVLKLSRWWSHAPWSLARFLRSDFFGDSTIDLKESICMRIKQETGIEHRGSVRLLANLRYFGFSINPIVTYYCFDESEKLQFIVAEVTNTPWNERISYVLCCDPDAKKQRFDFLKGMHVSPFNPMDMRYFWLSNNPSKRLQLHLETSCGNEVIVDATLSLKRTEITSSSLTHTIWRYPWMTIKVAVAIYWQALVLWVKRVPFYGHPNNKLTTDDQ